MEEAELSKGLPVVTVCGAGHSSRTAAEQLRARGYVAPPELLDALRDLAREVATLYG